MLDFEPAMAGFLGSGRITFRGLSVLLPGWIAAGADLGPSPQRV